MLPASIHRLVGTRSKTGRWQAFPQQIDCRCPARALIGQRGLSFGGGQRPPPSRVLRGRFDQDLDVRFLGHQCLEAFGHDVVQRDPLGYQLFGIEIALLHQRHDRRIDVAIGDGALQLPFLEHHGVGVERGITFPDRDDQHLAFMPGGLPATQGEWVAEVQDWFAKTSPGREIPDESTIRRRLTPIWRALREIP